MNETLLLYLHGSLSRIHKSASCLCSDIFLNINKLSCHLWLEEEGDCLPPHTGWVTFIHHQRERVQTCTQTKITLLVFIRVLNLSEWCSCAAGGTHGCGYSSHVDRYLISHSPKPTYILIYDDLSTRAQKCSITASKSAFLQVPPGATAGPRSVLLLRAQGGPEETRSGACARERPLSRRTRPSLEPEGTASGPPCRSEAGP